MEIFTKSDLNFMLQRGSKPENVAKLFEFYTTGFSFAKINRNTKINDGILKFTDEEVTELIAIYETMSQTKSILKFVPASGAASRMFKDLYEACSEPVLSKNAKIYRDRIKDFAFFQDLKQSIEDAGHSFEEMLQNDESAIIYQHLLEEHGLNYGNLPKGLLKFHNYGDEKRTALEEHLVESANYAQSGDGVCRIHFTVSPNHLENFKALVSEVSARYEHRFGVVYNISYSIQEPATDTLAAELNNTPFRDKNGNLLFRPGGHGALILNLNKLAADLVFIKNIDNVTTEDKLETTIQYKKALAGYLLKVQEKSFVYQKLLTKNKVDDVDLLTIIEFAKKSLMIQFETSNPTREEVFAKLHRPMRICGVVKNVGEPGGGPFWVTNREEVTSLQIVETSQIDTKDAEQNALLKAASHFNPVDLFCCYRDFEGNYFNLLDYVDEFTGFISEKSYEGRTLKAMELPGLWNGAMANWITIFVDVPLCTFNPVKTVFDLLPPNPTKVA